MMKRILLCFFILLAGLSACKKQEEPKSLDSLSLNSFRELIDPAYFINPDSIRWHIRHNLSAKHDTTAWDSAAVAYYTANDTLIWLDDRAGLRADSLLYWLQSAHRHGLNPELFSVTEIRDRLDRFRSLHLNEDESISQLLANLEYSLTRSYLHYACGLRFGFLSPTEILLEEDKESISKPAVTKQKKMKTLYHIPLKKCNIDFANSALSALKRDACSTFRQAQPTSRLYLSMQHELDRLDSLGEQNFDSIPLIGDTLLILGDRHRAVPLIARRLMQTGELSFIPDSAQGDVLTSDILDAVNQFRINNRIATDQSIGSYSIRYLNRPLSYYKDRLALNMERARWQYAQEKGTKYAIVNVAAFMLQAVNEETDSILEMRTCCGSVRNKTPLLSSKIYYMELNPYWNVPQSIIRKEIIPTYRRDTTYFTRNRMKVYDKNGERVNPHNINWSKYKAGVPFTVKQDNKAGNSLGRIIYRFPNSFAVYLHDTPSRRTFARANRAVSHGCIRLERALDFAFFLLKEPDELLEDRIRIAMDIAPVSDEGKKLRISQAYRELKHYSLEESIPVYLDYQTVYLDAAGKLSYCDDVYKYDAPLLEALNKLNYK